MIKQYALEYVLLSLLQEKKNILFRLQEIKLSAFADVFQKRSFQKFRNIHRKTPVLEYLFNKVAGFRPFFTEIVRLLLLRSIIFVFC